jgi:hypothetical protein
MSHTGSTKRQIGPKENVGIGIGIWCIGDVVYGTLLLLVVLVAGRMILQRFALDHHALVAGDGLSSLGL